MPLNATRDERRILAAALLSMSVAAAGWAIATAGFAVQHMAASAALCGPTSPHCGWCVAALAGLAVSLASAGLALTLLRSPAPCRAAIGDPRRRPIAAHNGV